jgi:hypothetical protein
MHGISSAEDLDPWLFLISLALGGLAALAGVVTGRIARRQASPMPKNDSSLADRIQRLSSTAVLAKVLADEISAEVSIIEKRADRLSEEAEQAAALGALNDEHRRAMAEVLRVELQDVNKRGRVAAFWSSAAWFVAGIAASIIVTLFVRPF